MWSRPDLVLGLDLGTGREDLGLAVCLAQVDLDQVDLDQIDPGQIANLDPAECLDLFVDLAETFRRRPSGLKSDLK